jgi:outer membrane immunogenic protein
MSQCQRDLSDTLKLRKWRNGDSVKALLLPAAALVALTAVGAAGAADLPVKAPPIAPVVAPTNNWTGFYVGGNAGLATGSTTGTSDFIDTSVIPPLASNPQAGGPSNSGFIGGAQFGYNWQVDPHIVLGAEGDWDWLRTKYTICRQTDLLSTACTDDGFGFASYGSQANWFATARARAGWTIDRFMFYGTGGAAWGSIQTTDSLSCLVAGCGLSALKLAASSTVTQTKTGWAAGFGAEGMLDAHWSVKFEWLHIDLGNLSNTFTTVGSVGTQSVVWSRDERFETFRAGVNYRFGAL